MKKSIGIASAALVVALASAACAAQFSHEHPDGPKPWTGEGFLDDPQEFHFAIIGDLAGGERSGVYAEAVKKLNLLRPEFVMSVGDLVAGGGVEKAALQKQWDSFRARTAKLEMPFFYVVGNHDIWTGFSGMTPARQASIDLWKEQFGPKTYYSFTYKDCLFVCLDSMERHDYYPPREALSDSQTAFVLAEFEKHANARWRFIFMHKPLDWTSDGWLALERKIGKYDYTVFCGDWHNYCTATRHGKKYYLLGTTGGGRGKSPAGDDLRAGVFDGITWVTVTRDKGPVVSHIVVSGVHDGDTVQSCATTRGWIEAPCDYPSHRSEDPAIYADEKNSALVPTEVERGPGYDWHFRHAILLRQGRCVPAGYDSLPPGRRVLLLGDETASALKEGYGEGWCAIDLGFAGDRVENVLWRVIEGELEGYDPERVVISVGRHNKGVNSEDEIAAGVAKLVRYVRNRVPGAEILVK